MVDSYRENSAINAIDLKQSVRAATTANITLSGTQTIDGVSVVAGNRVLAKNQSTGSQNGIYVVAAGSWARSADANQSEEVTSNFLVFVEEGTANADTGWLLTTNAPITLGTTALVFARFTGVSDTYAGQTTITTLGTIATGTWQGTAVAVAYGGTGATNATAALANLGAASSSHAHGNISNTGTIGSTANLPIITTTSGVITTGSFGSTANTFCQGNDSRLSDTRTPTDGTVTTAKLVDSNVTYAKIQNVSATDRILGRSSAGAGVVEEVTCTSFGRSLIDDADAAAARSTLGLVIGTNVQAYDAELAALAGVTSAANALPYFTGAGTATTTTLSSFGRTLIDDADASAALTTLGAASSSHAHGNITSAGAIGSTANLPIITTTSGVLTTGSFGSTVNTFCQGNDSRLSDTRTPTDGTVTAAKLVDSNVTYAKIQNVSATDRILGRSSAGAGVVEEVTCTSFGRSLIDDADATAARSTLGLVIGTNVQAYDAELAAIAGLTSAADAVPYFTGSGTASTTTLTSFGRTLIDDADAATARSTLGLVIGTNVQAYDAELAALAGVTSAANALPYFTGAGTATTTTLSSFGRTLIDDADASAALTTLGAASSSHAHGNITSAGAIGATANLPIITTTSGVLTTGSFGSTASTFCQGDDSRLSNTRTPTSYSTTIGNGSATSFTVTHSLNVTNDAFVVVRDTTNNYYVYPDIKYVDANSVLIEFVSAPTSSQYKVTVVGA